MLNNDINESDMDNIELQEGDGNHGNSIACILGFIGTFVFGFFIGNMGKKKAVSAAYKKGYNDASVIFEKKFKIQHDAFVKKELDLKEHEEEYLQLIAEYESYIEELELEDAREENNGKISFFKVKLEEIKELEESCRFD